MEAVEPAGVEPAGVEPAIDDLLTRMEHAVLGTLMGDGSPQASTLWFLWTGDEFLLSTRPTTAKWKNLERDPRCSICVDDPATGEMAVAYGVARLNDGDIRDLTRQILGKYYGNSGDFIDLHFAQIFEKERSIISVTPDRIVGRQVKTRRSLT